MQLFYQSLSAIFMPSFSACELPHCWSSLSKAHSQSLLRQKCMSFMTVKQSVVFNWVSSITRLSSFIFCFGLPLHFYCILNEHNHSAPYCICRNIGQTHGIHSQQYSSSGGSSTGWIEPKYWNAFLPVERRVVGEHLAKWSEKHSIWALQKCTCNCIYSVVRIEVKVSTVWNTYAELSPVYRASMGCTRIPLQRHQNLMRLNSGNYRMGYGTVRKQD